MDRVLIDDLIAWKDLTESPPILLRGARQVGKSYLVEYFGQHYFPNFLVINFELEQQFHICFESLDPETILKNIYFTSGQQVTPGETLLFLDEIQACPKALQALRYFKEKLPNLHVIAAGSLLEFVINDENFQMPVGRVQSMYLKPLSFSEFLFVEESHHLLECLENASLTQTIDDNIHQILLDKIRLYFFLGGMPDPVNTYLDTKNYEQVQMKQMSLFNLYCADFGKYATKVKHRYMRKILEKAPSMLGTHIKYSKIDLDIGTRELREALNYLVDASLIHKIHHTAASGLPLNAFVNEKKFKLLMLDLGLARAMSEISPATLLQKDLVEVNRGLLAEQFVGQELLAYKPSYVSGSLHYWEREKASSSAEVDYVIHVDDVVIPIEVKAGKRGTLRSMHVFMKEKQSPLGIRISSKPLSYQDNILSIPFYMIGQLERLCREIL